MQDLVGKQFSLEQDSFRIVDVRNFSGNYMVYAEHAKSEAAHEPARRAFHFEDIAHLIVPVRSA
ncbi:MAG: hypothetical protein ACR2PZ_12905 [Pseudomonadales bacterium]